MTRGIRFTRMCGICCMLMSLGVQAQVEPKAENRLMRLDQAGAGLWAQLGRPDASISRVTLAGNPGQMLYLQFVLAAGGKRELSGRLEQKDAYMLRIRITNSGSADASGSILIDYGAKNSINTLLGSGRVDGQPFIVQFTRRAPLQLNLIALGTGTWAQTGSEATQVQRVSCFQDSALQAEAAFFLADGQTRRVAGRVERKPGSPKIRLMLSKSGMANATGELTIQLGRKNRIASVDGDFQIDGQPVRVHFESAPATSRSPRCESMRRSLPSRKATGRRITSRPPTPPTSTTCGSSESTPV